MQIEATNNQNIGFSYTTSSGKSLSLSMFDNQSASYSKENGSASLSLRREYGFSFTFEGSKLTQTDIAEIKDAMKNVEPLINDFLQNSKVSELTQETLSKALCKWLTFYQRQAMKTSSMRLWTAL